MRLLKEAMRIQKNKFEDLVREIHIRVIGALPADLRAKAELVSVITADRPSRQQLDDTGGIDDLLGLYEGISLPERHTEDSGTLPDRITLFRLNLADYCADMGELREEIRMTILHELGHYFGFDEDYLENRGL